MDVRAGIGTVVAAALVAAAVAAASRLCRRRMPTLVGPTHALASIVVALTALLVPAQFLGAVGLFRPAPLVIAIAATCAGLLAAAGPPARVATGPLDDVTPRAARVVSWTIVGAVVAAWAWRSVAPIRNGGTTDYDSVHYHLRFAAGFVHDAWTTRLTYVSFDPTHAFHPLDGELLQALTMVALGNDLLACTLNLAWFGLLVLASWCVGARWRAGSVGALAGAAVGALPIMVSTQPGTANTDVGALALLLAAVALLLHADDERAVLGVAGLATGLAVATKLTVLAPAGLLTIAVVVARRRSPRAVAVWFAGLAAGGAYWYARNLVRTGNPLPNLSFGGLLPSPDFPIITQYGPNTLLHYVTSPGVFVDAVRPVLGVFGAVPLVVLVTIAGLAAFAMRYGSATVRLLAAFAAVLGVVYLATPMTAFGPPDHPHPWIVGSNTRYLVPALALAMLAGVAASARRPAWLAGSAAALAGVAVLAGLRDYGLREDAGPVIIGGAVALVAVLVSARAEGGDAFDSDGVVPRPVGAAVADRTVSERPPDGSGHRTRATAALAAAVGVVAALAVAGAVARRTPGYLDEWYVRSPERGVAAAWAAVPTDARRVGVSAVELAYPLTGPRFDTDVRWILHQRPHGGIEPPRSCRDWRETVNRGAFDWLVLSNRPEDSPLLGLPDAVQWTSTDPASRLVAEAADIRVFRVRGPLDPSRCAA